MATRTYENIVVMGDINIDTDDDKAIDQNKLTEFVISEVSDYHKMVLTTMRANYERLKPTKIHYCSHRNFCEKDFLRDLQNIPFHTCMDMKDKEAAYISFKNMFKRSY